MRVVMVTACALGRPCPASASTRASPRWMPSTARSRTPSPSRSIPVRPIPACVGRPRATASWSRRARNVLCRLARRRPCLRARGPSHPPARCPGRGVLGPVEGGTLRVQQRLQEGRLPRRPEGGRVHVPQYPAVSPDDPRGRGHAGSQISMKHPRLLLPTLLLLASTVPALAAPGDLDLGFNGTGFVVTVVPTGSSQAKSIARQ